MTSINYGAGPDPDELEVIVFGRGYGEAIAVHLGQSMWMLVDSCRIPRSKIPATLDYLRQIGVAPESVKSIVASHWHDDHVQGITCLAEAYPDADIFVSNVLSEDEAKVFVATYSGVAAPGQTRATKELFDLTTNRAVIFTDQRTIVFEAGDSLAQVVAYSPTPDAFATVVQRLAPDLPTANPTIGHGPILKPNLESIVLHIQTPQDAVLLGSDLEEHAQFGWASLAAVGSFCARRRPASVYKVAHHGSDTAEHVGIWANLLQAAPEAVLTPFRNGSVALPKDPDRVRIRSKTSASYISSNGSSRSTLPSYQSKRLGAIARNVKAVGSTLGAVRFRRRLDASDHWRTELFGAAALLQKRGTRFYPHPGC